MITTDYPDDWTIIFWDPSDRWQWTATEVFRRPGESIKDLQDRIAENNKFLDTVIYTVVKREEYRAMMRRTAFDLTGA